MNRLLTLLACLVVALGAHAQGPDEQYVRIYQLIQDADRLNDLGDKRTAAARYVEAQQALSRFRGIYPGWNERVINYRLNYVATKLASLASTLAAPGTTTAPPPNTATSPVPATPLPAATNLTSTPPTNVPSTTALPMSAEFDQVRALQGEIDQLKAENKRLDAKLREALSAQPAALDPRELARAEERIRSLQKENELFKAQVSTLKTAAATPVVPPEMTAKIAEQNDTIVALRTENEILKKQTAEWRDKYASLNTTAEAARTQFSTQLAEKEATVIKLSAENTGLQKQVELWKQVAQNNQRQNALAPIPSMPPDAQRELLSLRARVQALEAKPVPYTAEELALFNKPSPTLVANVATTATPAPASPANSVPPIEKAPAKVSRGIPPGTGPILKAAERAFAMQQYAEAEKKYLEVLHQDEKNVTTLGNLASAQVELGRLEDAEKTVQRALALDPEDYFSLYVLGRIRFRQDKLDEALDALSRSVQANVNYADAQNYLGIVLSEKGQRGPAEAALRRAIQLQPDNAVAHNNLAVVYATQKPPALALARWHYQKARDAGHPKNTQLEQMLEVKPR
jgi:tetratricopeptide (TPR) repeat protein